MSEATRAKSAKARATIAIRKLKTVKDLGCCRAFDDCFEMGDGDYVVREIIRRAAANPKLTELLKTRGCGQWLEPGYLRADLPDTPPVVAHPGAFCPNAATRLVVDGYVFLGRRYGN